MIVIYIPYMTFYVFKYAVFLLKYYISFLVTFKSNHNILSSLGFHPSVYCLLILAFNKLFSLDFMGFFSLWAGSCLTWLIFFFL